MSATAEQPQIVATRPRAWPALPRAPLWLVVALSRAMIVAIGSVTALTTSRYAGWDQYDPTRSSARLGSVGNILAASGDRWDAIHYLAIAEHGYRVGADTSFFPLYPLLIRALTTVLGSYVVAGLLISYVSFAIAMVLLHRLVSDELDRQTARLAVTLLAFAPLSFFFTSVYTESLFLAMSIGAFHAARRERWAIAALLAAACSATRVPGVLVIVPVLYMWWHSPNRTRRPLALFALVPVPLLGFCVYLQSTGFGFMSALHNESAAYDRTMTGPIGTIAMAIQSAISTPIWRHGSSIPWDSGVAYNRWLLIVLVLSLVALAGVWRRLPRPYAIYATLVLCVDLWSPIPLTPLRSFDRYAMVVFPLWIYAAIWVREHRVARPVLAISAVILTYYVHQVAIWGVAA